MTTNKNLEHRLVNPKKQPITLLNEKTVIPRSAGDVGKKKLMLWKLARYTYNSDQVVPRFTGWRIMVSDACGSPTKTVITYLPPIHKPITENDTVVEFLHQVQEMAHQLNMPYVRLTLDVGAAAHIMFYGTFQMSLRMSLFTWVTFISFRKTLALWDSLSVGADLKI